MMVNVGIVACAIFGLSRAPSFYLATALLIFNSLGLAMNFGLANTIVQERAPDYLRGRVSAVFMLSFVGLMPVAGLGITGLSDLLGMRTADRKSTRLNSSHVRISYAVFCLKKKKSTHHESGVGS